MSWGLTKRSSEFICKVKYYNGMGVRGVFIELNGCLRKIDWNFFEGIILDFQSFSKGNFQWRESFFHEEKISLLFIKILFL